MNAKTKEKPAENLPAVQQGTANLPAEFLAELEQDAGLGVSTDANEVGIPFLYILQDLSPQVKKRDEAYIEGAEVGDIYNNVTREIIPGSEGFDWIEVGFEAAQVEWKANRGGFVAKHPNDTPLLQQVKAVDNGEGRMTPTLPNGNILTETKYHYGLYRRAGGAWEPAVIGMASSMIKNSRELEGLKRRVKLASGAVAPAYAVHYHFKTKLQSKNNNEWFTWDISQGSWVTSEELRVGRELALQVAQGTIKTSAPGEETQGSALDEEVL